MVGAAVQNIGYGILSNNGAAAVVIELCFNLGGILHTLCGVLEIIAAINVKDNWKCYIQAVAPGDSSRLCIAKQVHIVIA